MYRIYEPSCPKCGEQMFIRWIPSSGMDIEKTGMKAECKRCGFSKFISALDEKVNT